MVAMAARNRGGEGRRVPGPTETVRRQGGVIDRTAQPETVMRELRRGSVITHDMDTDTLDARRPRMRVSGIHLLTGLVVAVVALWILTNGFPVQVVSDLDAELPAAASGEPLPDHTVEVAVRADGRCVVRPPSDGEARHARSVAELRRLVDDALRHHPGGDVLLRVDRDTPWIAVSAVLDVLRTHGAGTVWFATAAHGSGGSTI